MDKIVISESDWNEDHDLWLKSITVIRYEHNFEKGIYIIDYENQEHGNN